MFLKKYGLQFDCHTPIINETPEKSESAESFVKRMSHEKALQVQRTYSKNVPVYTASPFVPGLIFTSSQDVFEKIWPPI
jgi:predicted house-cleaning NTP pyrophosphatase (Maf/HAM1 superfamily)